MDEPELTFSAVRLNAWTDRGWAVVDDVTGAIVDVDGKLALKLTEQQARSLALGHRRSPDGRRPGALPRA